MNKQHLRFASIGTVGFGIDSAVLYEGLRLGLNPLWGRLISFIFAAFCTWLLNRRYTFSDQAVGLQQSIWKEWLRYLAAMSGGGAINLSSYMLLMALAPPQPTLPLLAVGVGSVTGLFFNFSSAKWWVYRQDR